VYDDHSHVGHTFNRTFFLDAMLSEICVIGCSESVLLGDVLVYVSQVNIGR